MRIKRYYLTGQASQILQTDFTMFLQRATLKPISVECQTVEHYALFQWESLIMQSFAYLSISKLHWQNIQEMWLNWWELCWVLSLDISRLVTYFTYYYFLFWCESHRNDYSHKLEYPLFQDDYHRRYLQNVARPILEYATIG